MHIPSSLLTHCRNLVPGFADEAPRDQMALACMLWMSSDTRREHIRYEGMFSLSKKDIRKVWGSDQRMRETVGSRHFSALRGSNLGPGYTNAYRPCHELSVALAHCFADSSNEEWIDAEGRVMRAIPRAIAALSSDGKRKTKWESLSPARAVRIDVPSLEALRCRLDVDVESVKAAATDDELSNAAVESALDLQARQLIIDSLIKMSRNTACPGSTPIRYVEASTGRLFAEGLSLQSAPREIRNAALAGCWDYDISNCHWSLINQLAAKHGHTCAAIQHYLDNKQQVRTEIASGAGISIQEAKECLLMTMYGAPASLFEKDGEPQVAIPKLIGTEAARRLYQNSAFIRLHTEVKEAREIIVTHLRGNASRGGWIVNALGLRIARKKPPKRILAHILQGVEAKALMAVVREYGGDVLLCVHDGWVTRQRLAVADLQNLIRQAIGLDVEVEETFLGPELLVEDTPAASPTINIDLRPETEHPCGFPGDFQSVRATSSPVSAAAFPGSTPTGLSGPRLVLTERPPWNWPPEWGRASGPRVRVANRASTPAT